MDTSRTYALIIWVNDDPVTGNILSVSNIVEPRTAYSSYSVGDKVKAKCPGFGVHYGVIGKFGSATEKKQLEDILKGNQFVQLAKKYTKKDSETRLATDSSKTPAKTPAKPPKTPKVTKKRKTQDTPSAPKQKQSRNLEAVAQDLEFTELQQQVQFTEVQQQVQEDVSEDEMSVDEHLPSSQVYKQSMDVLLTDASAVCIDCTILQGQVTSQSQEIQTLQTQLQSAQSTVQTLQSQLHSTQSSVHSLHQQVGNLQYYVQCLWNKYQVQMNVPDTPQTPTTSYQTRYQSPATPDQPSSRLTSINHTPRIQPTTTSTLMSSTPQQTTTEAHIHTTPTQPSTTASSVECDTQEQILPEISRPHSISRTPFFNNYSQEILEAKVQKLKDFSKCAKVLLRLLYTDEERRGRSISGSAANNKYSPKPALQHQERLEVIYDIIGKRWPTIPKKEINGKLAEALKPSVSKQ